MAKDKRTPEEIISDIRMNFSSDAYLMNELDLLEEDIQTSLDEMPDNKNFKFKLIR